MGASGQSRYVLMSAIADAREVPQAKHAYQYIATDVAARFGRLDGSTVHHLAGSRERGTTDRRSPADPEVQDSSEVYSKTHLYERLHEVLRTSLDSFIRTTDIEHHRICAALWKTMLDNRDLYVATYTGWYSPRDSSFYPASEIMVDSGGGHFATSSGEPVEWIAEPVYYFRLSEYRDQLLKFHMNRTHFVIPAARRDEVLAVIVEGLDDVPIAPAVRLKATGRDRHVFCGRMCSVAAYFVGLHAVTKDEVGALAGRPRVEQFITKDDLQDHAIFRTAVLMSFAIEPPQRLYVHGDVVRTERKSARSLPPTTDPFELVAQYGVDRVRYYLLREAPFDQDRDVVHRAIVHRTDADLAWLSTVAYSVLSLISKYCKGVVPSPSRFENRDTQLMTCAGELLIDYRKSMETRRFDVALNGIWSVLGKVEGYLSAEKPWALRTTDPMRMNTVLYVALDALRCVAVLIQPIVPQTAALLLDQLGVRYRDFAGLAQGLKPGVALPEPSRVFHRYSRKASRSLPGVPEASA